jgi:hypothetical protein
LSTTKILAIHKQRVDLATKQKSTMTPQGVAVQRRQLEQGRKRKRDDEIEDNKEDKWE